MTTPYRHIDPALRRRAVVAEACRVRDTLAAIPCFYNIGGKIGSSKEIIDALTACVEELSAS